MKRSPTKVPCKACPHFWPAPKEGGLFVGWCRLSRRWLLAYQRCNPFFVKKEEQRQSFRKEVKQ